MIGYIIAQVIGAILGALFVFVIAMAAGGSAFDTNIGSNTYNNPDVFRSLGAGIAAALLIEIVLTFVFVLTILAITTKIENKKIAPALIGVALLLVHLVGIPLTGTSVNPARSLGPALFSGWAYLQQVWLFLIAPIIGGVLAAFFAKWFFKADKPEVE